MREDRVTCRFCTWYTKPFSRKRGRKVDGYQKLIDHLFGAHPEEIDKFLVGSKGSPSENQIPSDGRRKG